MGDGVTALSVARPTIGAGVLAMAAWDACRLRRGAPAEGVRLAWGERGVGRCAPATAAALEAHGARPAALDGAPALALAGASWAEAMAIATRALSPAAGAATRTGAAERIQVLDDAGRTLPAAPRGLAVPLGLRMAGVHLTGYVATEPAAGAPMTLILARRGARQDSHPGQLDTLAGGVRGTGEGASACLRREAWEEAGLLPAVLRTGRSFGAISFDLAVPGGYARGRAVLAELALPRGWLPRPQDGTVSAFHAVAVAPGAAEARAVLPIKPTAALATVASLQRSPARAAFAAGELGRILSAADFRTWPPRALAAADRGIARPRSRRAVFGWPPGPPERVR